MARVDPAVAAHLEWLGFAQPTGLVVSAHALVRAGAILNTADMAGQRALREALLPGYEGLDEEPVLPDFESFARGVLGWGFSPKGYAGTSEAPIPETLSCRLEDLDLLL